MSLLRFPLFRLRERGLGGERRNSVSGCALHPPAPSPLLAVLTLLLLTACAKPKKPADEVKKKEEAPLPSLAVGGGDVTVYGSATATEPSFTVHWKGGGFDAAKGTVSTGHLDEPKGEIFADGKSASTYRADTGDAIREAKRLDMRGNVVLRSADGKQTLKAPAAQYRGDVRLIRATGGVTASGTFGTLSGVPELWATPDLRLIGTPDMVSKTLKLPALLALAATAATGSAKLQNGADSLTGYKPFKVVHTATGTRVTASPPPGGTMVLTMASRGLVFRLSGTAVVDLDAKTQVRRFTAQGKVNMVQMTPAAQNTIDGNDPVYVAKPGEATADLDLDGPVTLTTKTKAQTTVSKGRKGKAVLVVKPAPGENGLRSATLTGDVALDAKGTGGDTFNGTGERLVYVPRVDSSDVDLTGGVVLTRITKGPNGSNTVVSRGQTARAVLDPSPAPGANPMKTATLTGGIAINVSGSNGDTFQGTGNKVVYTAQGDGGSAVMTGDLKFSGNATSFLGDTTGADTATVVIGKDGWETIETSNSGGGPSSTTIKTKTPPAVPKHKAKKGAKP